MASSCKCNGSDNGGGEEDLEQIVANLSEPLKSGERILAPTRRPDGTLRKPVRIRAGYVPQDEVAIYQSRGALWKKEMASMQEMPPGYDPASEPKPKTKSAKRNERKKEKRQQAALDKSKMSENDDISTGDSNNVAEPEESIAYQMNALAISQTPSVVTPPKSTESSTPANDVQDIDKKIRALKKKIRLTEAQQQKTADKAMTPELLEKVSKLEDWRKELKLLEDKKAEL